MSAMPEPRMVDESLIRHCKNGKQALSLCIRMSGYTDEVVADRVGISKGYLSKILNGRASLKSDLRIRLMEVCGNLAPLQYEARAMGMSLQAFDPVEQRRQQLLAELESLGRAA